MKISDIRLRLVKEQTGIAEATILRRMCGLPVHAANAKAIDEAFALCDEYEQAIARLLSGVCKQGADNVVSIKSTSKGAR